MSVDPAQSPRFSFLVVAVLTALAGGCTIGPDPFDYSGPVPNGSQPQNDFRARSNGILPLNAAPRPYPPLVEAAPAPAGVRPPRGEDDVAGEGLWVAAADMPLDESDSVSAARGDAGDAADYDVASPTDAAELQPVEETAPAPLAETPGWRTRD